MNNIGCRILPGTILKWLIAFITLGMGKRLATWYFVQIRGKESCGCCEREERINKWFCKSFDGKCNQLKFR